MKQKYNVCTGLLLDFEISREINNPERLVQLIIEEELEKAFIEIEKKIKNENILMTNSMVEYIEGDYGEPC